MKRLPRRNIIKVVGNYSERNERHMIPFIVALTFHKVSFEEARRLDEQPVRRVDDIEISFVIGFPNLRHERLVGLDESLYVFFE